MLLGTWLVTLFAVFSLTTTINTYYTAALSPAVAGLLGIGLVLAWQHRRHLLSWLALSAIVLATAGYSTWLLPAEGTGVPGLQGTAVIGLAVAAIACLAAAAAAWQRGALALAAAGMTLAAAGMTLVPAVAAAAVVRSGLGPFETPLAPARETARLTAFLSAGFEIKQSLAVLERANAALPYLMATQTALQRLIRTAFVVKFLQSPTTTDPRLTWIARHCINYTPRGGSTRGVLPLAVYVCLPSVAP